MCKDHQLCQLLAYAANFGLSHFGIALINIRFIWKIFLSTEVFIVASRADISLASRRTSASPPADGITFITGDGYTFSASALGFARKFSCCVCFHIKLHS